MKLGEKINIIFITIFLIGSTILGVVLSITIQGSIEDFATDKEKNDSNIVYEYIDKVVDIKMLVDIFSEKAGDDVTFTIGEAVDATTLTNVLQHGTAFYWKVTGTNHYKQRLYC